MLLLGAAMLLLPQGRATDLSARAVTGADAAALGAAAEVKAQIEAALDSAVGLPDVGALARILGSGGPAAAAGTAAATNDTNLTGFWIRPGAGGLLDGSVFTVVVRAEVATQEELSSRAARLGLGPGQRDAHGAAVAEISVDLSALGGAVVPGLGRIPTGGSLPFDDDAEFPSLADERVRIRLIE